MWVLYLYYTTYEWQFICLYVINVLWMIDIFNVKRIIRWSKTSQRRRMMRFRSTHYSNLWLRQTINIELLVDMCSTTTQSYCSHQVLYVAHTSHHGIVSWWQVNWSRRLSLCRRFHTIAIRVDFFECTNNVWI